MLRSNSPPASSCLPKPLASLLALPQRCRNHHPGCRLIVSPAFPSHPLRFAPFRKRCCQRPRLPPLVGMPTNSTLGRLPLGPRLPCLASHQLVFCTPPSMLLSMPLSGPFCCPDTFMPTNSHCHLPSRSPPASPASSPLPLVFSRLPQPPAGFLHFFGNATINAPSCLPLLSRHSHADQQRPA